MWSCHGKSFVSYIDVIRVHLSKLHVHVQIFCSSMREYLKFALLHMLQTFLLTVVW